QRHGVRGPRQHLYEPVRDHREQAGRVHQVIPSGIPARDTTARSAEIDSVAEQTERWGAEIKHRRVEALEAVAGSPLLAGALAKLEDLQFAPGVAAVGGVERGPPGLGERGGAGQMGVRLEPARRL